jgi:conjugal transfer mating pair stabilization protein TraN
MKRLLLPLLCLACASLSSGALAQTTTEAAKADGKAFGRDKAADAQGAATTEPDANRIPNFGSVPSQSGYFDDPDRMAREAASQATANTGYRTMRDSMDRRAQFAPQDLDAVVARSNVINDDPLSYTSGMSISGSQGRCVPLPPGTGTAARYMATCNVGYTATQETRTCPVTLNATIEQRQVYGYYCVGGSGVDPASIYNCNRYPAPQCTVTQSYPINLCDPYLGIYWGCNSGDLRVDLVSCTAPVDGATPYSVTGENVVTTSRDESQCAGLAADNSCQQDAETCTDSDPVTRIIDGIAVTQPCWVWSRSYTCAQFTQAQDCQTLESTPGCSLVREDCLSGEPCRTWERVYDCPVPDQPAIPASSSATATSTASMARARRSSARPMTSSRMPSSRSTRWTRHGASSIPTRSPCSRARAIPARPRFSACSIAARAKASRSFRVSSCSSRSAAAARKCCSTSAMRRACAPMSGLIAQTASSASA